MLRLRGKQLDTARYFYGGHTYHRDMRNGTDIFRCTSRNNGCNARLYSSSTINLADAVFTQQENHNHEGDPFLPLRQRFDDEVSHLARTTFEDCKRLFDRIKMKEEYEPIRRDVNYYHKYKTMMDKARKENVPPVPRDLLGLGDILHDYVPVNSIFRGMVTGVDESVALLFIHPTMLEALRECRQLFCDGTFKIRPRRPHTSQVFIIHFRKMNTGFPAVYAYTSAKTAAMYDAIWVRLKELVPELEDNIDGITSDFEKAQIKSAKRNFPNARISGCLFHYKQCLAKKWDKLNIPEALEYILEKAYALAHLPPGKMQEGILHIETLVNGLGDDVATDAVIVKLKNFAAYLRTFWLPLAGVLSVNGKPVKTNNTAENFHLHARKNFGDRPNVYKELDELIKLTNRQADDYEAVLGGGRLNPRRPRDLQTSDMEIQSLEREVALDRIPVPDFLTTVASKRRCHLSRVFLYNEQVHQQQRAPEPAENNGAPIDNQLLVHANAADADAADEYGHFRLEQQGYLLANLVGDPAPGGAFENEVVERRRGVDHVYRDEEQMPQPPGPPPVAVARRRGRPRRGAQNARGGRGRPAGRPLANGQIDAIPAPGDDIVQAELGREVDPLELLEEQPAQPVRRGPGRPRIHPVREVPAANARGINGRGRLRGNARNVGVGHALAPHNDQHGAALEDGAVDVAPLDEHGGLERAPDEPEEPMPEQPAAPVRRGRGRPRMHPVREPLAGNAAAVNVRGRGRGNARLQRADGANDAAFENGADAPIQEEDGVDAVPVEVVDLADDGDIVQPQIAPVENGRQERLIAELSQLVANYNPVAEPEQPEQLDAGNEVNEQQVINEEEEVVVLEDSDDETLQYEEEIFENVEEEVIERHVFVTRSGVHEIIFANNIPEVPAIVPAEVPRHVPEIFRTLNIQPIGPPPPSLEERVAEQMVAHADDPDYDVTEATFDAYLYRPMPSPIAPVEAEAGAVADDQVDEDEQISVSLNAGVGASAEERIEQVSHSLVANDEPEAEQDDFAVQSPPRSPSHVVSKDSGEVQQPRSFAALQKAKRRKRRWLESNPEMRQQQKTNEEKKKEKNKKRKMKWITKQKEQAQEVLRLQTANNDIAQKNHELERITAEQQAKIERQQKQIVEIEDNVVLCACCQTKKPTRVWEPCGHSGSCEDCLVQLLLNSSSWRERKEIRCPHCNTAGQPYRAYLL